MIKIEDLSNAINSPIPTLIKFGAEWCSPYKKLNAILEGIDDDRFIIGIVDVDKNPELAEKYKIQSVPTMILFKDGQIINEYVGLTNKENILKLIFG
jgi:thioredoxin 1